MTRDVDSLRLPLPHEKVPQPKIFLHGKPILVLPAGSLLESKRDYLTKVKTISQLLHQIIYPCFGPRSMYKLIITEEGTSFLTSDAYTIFARLKVTDPVAQIIVGGGIDTGKNCGDGSSTSILLATRILIELINAQEEGIDSSSILRGCLEAHELIRKNKNRLSVEVEDPEQLIEKLVSRYLEGTILSNYKEHFARIIYNIVKYLGASGAGSSYKLENVYIRTALLSSPYYSRAIEGLALVREKHLYALFNSFAKVNLVLYKGEFQSKPKGITQYYDHKFRIKSPSDYTAFINWRQNFSVEEFKRLLEKNVNVVLVEKGAEKNVLKTAVRYGILVITRFSPQEFNHIAEVAGVNPISNIFDIRPDEIVTVRKIYHAEIGVASWWFIEGFPNPRGCEILLTGPNQLFLQEAERLIYGCLKWLRQFLEDPRVVCGGGHYELALAQLRREFSLNYESREQLVLQKISEALGIIPSLLAHSCGMDETKHS